MADVDGIAAAAGGMADVDGIAEIQVLDDRGPLAVVSRELRT
ncbi:MAG TPA: hypothetical protein VGJ82_10550 [Thermoanaerobaculia bacterium]